MPKGGADELLSSRLSCLAAWLREYEHDGMEMAPLCVQSFAAALSQAALDAGALERQVVPGTARVDHGALNGNIVPLYPDDVA